MFATLSNHHCRLKKKKEREEQAVRVQLTCGLLGLQFAQRVLVAAGNGDIVCNLCEPTDGFTLQ